MIAISAAAAGSITNQQRRDINGEHLGVNYRKIETSHSAF
jgi:hypothetical protein